MNEDAPPLYVRIVGFVVCKILRTLKKYRLRSQKMKHYDGGKEMVAALLKDYREVYKRRKYMMKELKGV